MFEYLKSSHPHLLQKEKIRKNAYYQIGSKSAKSAIIVVVVVVVVVVIIIINGAYVINFDEYRDIGTHWVTLHVNNKTVTYFDSFGVEHIPKEIMKFIGNKNIITSIFRIQAYYSIMCGYFCIGFINFMFNGNSLTDYTNLFSPNDLKKNDGIILKYFSL